MALLFEIEYLTGTFYGAAGPDTEEADWPPEPDRVFSALVATWAARGQLDEERQALEWLEQQSAPLVLASKAINRTAHESFVPPNDPTSSTKKQAIQVVPMFRSRQSRNFPASRPEDPVVRFLWADVRPPDNVVQAALYSLAHDTSYVGHSASLTRCRFISGDKTIIASEYRQPRRRVYPGRFLELRDAYEAGRRPPVGEWVPPRPSHPVNPSQPQSVFRGSPWLLLQNIGPEKPDIRASGLITKAIRDSLVAGYQEVGLGYCIPEEINGRTLDGKLSHRPHLAIIPMAFVGFPHADGHVLGYALVPPRDSRILEDANLLRVLRRLGPANSDGRRAWNITIGETGKSQLSIVLTFSFEPSARSMDPAEYVRCSRVFATVTPILLDRHLKRTGVDRQDEIADQITQACGYIGLPNPRRIEGREGATIKVSPNNHSAIEGVPSAEPSPGSPQWMRWKLPASFAGRTLTHAIIEFPEPVVGPIILGAGRFLGLGLCRPIQEQRSGRDRG